MDDKEVELSHHLTSNSSNTCHAPQKFQDPQAMCTHTHTCNPPGHDSTRTHPRYHTHRHVVSSKIDDNTLVKPRKPLGNRVAVRRYREKNKAQNAYMKEEVHRLRIVNQGLIRKLRQHAALEADAVRLRCLLLDLKAQINE